MSLSNENEKQGLSIFAPDPPGLAGTDRGTVSGEVLYRLSYEDDMQHLTSVE